MSNDELDNLMERAGLMFGHPFGRSQIYTLVTLAQEAKDATIDALMLEFCPERMSKEQIEMWSDSQEVVK